jgi:hypothetical protein
MTLYPFFNVYQRISLEPGHCGMLCKLQHIYHRGSPLNPMLGYFNPVFFTADFSKMHFNIILSFLTCSQAVM